MAAGWMCWAPGILAVALWAGMPYAVGQQLSPKHGPRHEGRSAHAGWRSTRRRQQRRAIGSAQQAGVSQVSNPGVSIRGVKASRVPQAGMPTLDNPRPTGTLETLPNQTLTPGATSVPGNAGGIAPASNDASSGEYTPSEGQTAPATPGGNPSETQGVPTFSSAAQPAYFNLPRTVSPVQVTAGAASAGKSQRKSH